MVLYRGGFQRGDRRGWGRNTVHETEGAHKPATNTNKDDGPARHARGIEIREATSGMPAGQHVLHDGRGPRGYDLVAMLGTACKSVEGYQWFELYCKIADRKDCRWWS